ncbi:tyrosine-type recombinase/integrase [Microbacterium rhizomatis]|uniref:Tyrosine-type recombinase/integrase n=1 Tax=Microbacterium rhizomatis TaxID=1631477 RepID=A0A5J5IZP0_9MICO|nr:tyrosine-type recombinase/integrase [Microbacterium rhizomatis]KAA9104998.1 tyrosine-type recombinase/integrase [Microbacterium rhizomatis]
MLTKEWSEAIEGFLAHERAGGKRTDTNRARREHLQHLARRVNVGPWGVSADLLLDYLAAQEWAVETRRGRRTSLARFYDWGAYRGLVTVNPVESVPKVKMREAHARPAPDRAYHEALMAARPREKLMLRLAAEVGMRRAEVAQVHTKDLIEDMVGHSLIVHGKGGKTRIVPLPVSLGRAIQHAEPGYLFPGRVDGHLSARYVGKMLAALIPDHWTMHTLRHRFAAKLFALTSDVLMVQETLGHASVSTTRLYIPRDGERARAAINELAG